MILNALVSFIPFLIVLLPHLIWLTENSYITITYGLDRTGTGDQKFLRSYNSSINLFRKTNWNINTFLFNALFLSTKFKTKFNFKDNKLLFLLTINIIQ